jgi:hypothetical protein
VLPTGNFQYNFNNNDYNELIDLTNSTSLSVTGSDANDQFLLSNSSGDTINGGKGNNTFVVGQTAGSLNGDIINGGAGFNTIQLNGSGTSIDLSGGGANSNGIEAVVAQAALTGESVNLAASELQFNGRLGNPIGDAFVALLGADGVVNFTQAGAYSFLGEVNSSGLAFDASGAQLTGSAATTLLSEASSITSVLGNLAADYAGARDHVAPTGETYVPNALRGYVFQIQGVDYTIWTDGTISYTYTVPAGGATVSLTRDAAGTAPQPTTYHYVSGQTAAPLSAAQTPGPGFDPGVYNQNASAGAQWVTGKLGLNATGLTTLLLGDGSTLNEGAVSLGSGVTGIVVRGVGGTSGSWFGLGRSGGANFVYGDKGVNIFDLQNTSSLQDILTGGTGPYGTSFNVVRSEANSADINLTALNATTGIAAHYINAVVGTGKRSQTIELDVNTLSQYTVGGDVNHADFTAFLGGTPGSSATDTLYLSSGQGYWQQVGSTFTPGGPLPAHADALTQAALLDYLASQGVGTAGSAEKSLTGYLFEQLNIKGQVVEYVTIYSDATVDISGLTAPTAPARPAQLSQALASFGASSGSVTASAASQPHSGSNVLLANVHA